MCSSDPYEVEKRGPDGPPAPIDVMNFIYEELIIHTQSKKTPTYAPFVMKLLVWKKIQSPLMTLNLVEHGLVKPQAKAVSTDVDPRGYKTYVSGDDESEDDENAESPPPASPSRRPRMKHASNVAMPGTSKGIVRQKLKKANFWQRTFCCMNVDIRHGQYDQYVQNKHIIDNQKIIIDELRTNRGEKLSTPSSESSGTPPYEQWSKRLVNWSDFDVVDGLPGTSRPHGNDSDYEDEDEGGNEDEDDEAEDGEDGSGEE